MRITFGIPSYKRPDKQKTLEYLESMWFTREDIIISTQTKEDYEAYSRNFGDRATIIFQEGHCVSDNRNTIIEHCKANGIKNLVMLDDDIVALNMFVSTTSNRPITSRNDFLDILKSCFSKARQYRSPVWGVYPIDNPYFQHTHIKDKNLLIGTCLGMCFFNDWAYDNIRFKPEMKVKEDYELCCKLIKHGFNVLRYDYLTVKADHYSKGGCEDVWADTTNIECAVMIESMYPELVKRQQKKPAEIRPIFNNKIIWQKNTTVRPDGQRR